MADQVKLVRFRTFENAIDAHMLSSRLESEGIVCFIFDENINNLNPLYSVTVGGVKLNIKSTDVAKALAILEEIEQTDFVDENDKVIACPKCHSTDLYSGFRSVKGTKGFLAIIALFFSLAFSLFPIYSKTVYRCKACDAEFKVK